MNQKIRVWTIKQLADNILKRQQNKYDCNIAVTGSTGDGKSTFAGKLLFRIDGFNPHKHMVFNRDDVIRLITKNKFGIVWDDEAINSSYKRQFQNVGQQELIKTVAMYRSNFNLYLAVLPDFFSLDKDLRDLYAVHIFIIRRGLAVMFRRAYGKIFSDDKWNTKYNKKLEESWEVKKAKSPNFKIPYHKLKGFVAYIKFGDLTPNQRALIDKIKEQKRAESFEKTDTKELPFIDKVYGQLTSGNLTKDGLSQICLMEGKKYSSIGITLNRKLKDKGEKRTVKDFFEIAVDENQKDSIKSITSRFPKFEES